MLKFIVLVFIRINFAKAIEIINFQLSYLKTVNPHEFLDHSL